MTPEERAAKLWWGVGGTNYDEGSALILKAIREAVDTYEKAKQENSDG